MINSFGTGKPTEADGERGSGRKRRQLFGLFGWSGSISEGEGSKPAAGVRLVGRRLSSPAWPAASGAKPPPAPRKAHWRAERSPTAAGASSSRIQQLSFSCAVVFAAVAYRRQRRGLSSPPHGHRRAEAKPPPQQEQQQS